MKRIILVTLIFISVTVLGQNPTKLETTKHDSVYQKLEILQSEFDSRFGEQEKRIQNVETELSKKETKNNSDITISVLSVLIALGLLIITYVNNKNNKNILTQQINQQKEINEEQQKIQRALQRPVVDAYRSGWKDKTELIMINYGLGPAVLEEITFEKKGHKPTSTISDLIDLKKIDKDIRWDDKWNYSKKDYYLYPQQKEKLYTITKENLMGKYGKSISEAEDIIEAVRKARDGITFKVKYVDIISKENPKKRIEYNTEIDIYSKKTSG